MHDVVEALDVLPSLMDLCGMQIPPHVQGHSLLPILEQEADDTERLAITEGVGWKTLQSGHFRYLIHDDGREGLWDLDADPWAYHDVAHSPHGTY